MIAVAYLVSLLLLGIYSYSQIDLNLTLFQNPLFLTFQHSLIQLGYFHRPQSTLIFVCLLLFISFSSAYFLKKPSQNLKILVVGLVLLGVFSYPAFSHDIYNYIFDARILITHHQNPYTSTALMFPLDDWTRFMNWTHRAYPYGPTFLPITLIFYMLGFGKFIITLFSFKLMNLLAFVGCAYLINRMAGRKSTLFFITNPLIIFEVVISAHLDIIMLFFALLSWQLLLVKRVFSSYISLIVSIGIKYSTALLIPAYIFKSLRLAVVLAFAGAFAQILSREVLPHYFIVPIGFVALMVTNKKLVAGTLVLSMFLILLRYYVFISQGVWQPIVVIR